MPPQTFFINGWAYHGIQLSYLSCPNGEVAVFKLLEHPSITYMMVYCIPEVGARAVSSKVDSLIKLAPKIQKMYRYLPSDSLDHFWAITFADSVYGREITPMIIPGEPSFKSTLPEIINKVVVV